MFRTTTVESIYSMITPKEDKFTQLRIINNLNEYELPDMKFISRHIFLRYYRLMLLILNQYVNHKERFLLHFSTTGWLLNYLPNSPSICRFLSLMQQYGIISLYNPYHRSGKAYDFINNQGKIIHVKESTPISRQFLWFPENAKIIRKKLLQLHIKPAKQLKLKKKINKELPKPVFIKSRTRYTPNNNISKEVYERQLRRGLITTYGDLITNLLKSSSEINKINKQKGHKERIKKCVPNFNWSSKSVSSIGFRAWNPVCDIKKYNPNGQNRQQYLNENNLYFEYDIKASILQVTYLLNKGKWLGNNIDLYKEIYREYCSLSGELFEWNEEIRKAVKYMFMENYFSVSIKQCSHYIKRAIGKNKIKVTNRLNSLVDRFTERFKTAMSSILGKSYDSEIFLHESAIYVEVEKKLLELGFEVANVYDCFYCGKEGYTETQFNYVIENIIQECAYDYLSNFNDWQIDQETLVA